MTLAVEQAPAVAPRLALVQDEPDQASAWRQIASDLRAAIACGALKPGDMLLPVTELASRYNVAPSTAHRAITDLGTAGAVSVSRGKRATVV
jgi:DNA-binding GntR family transcriptional regulator